MSQFKSPERVYNQEQYGQQRSHVLWSNNWNQDKPEQQDKAAGQP